MMKNDRQNMILEIISRENIETQEQLLSRLQDRGITSTQATISRDIKELRIVKELTSLGTYRYSVSEKDAPPALTDRLNTIFRECVTSIDYAENIIVIHTLAGMANAAGAALDAMKINVVLGTLAGDDTVMIVMRDANSAAAFSGEIKAVVRQ